MTEEVYSGWVVELSRWKLPYRRSYVQHANRRGIAVTALAIWHQLTRTAFMRSNPLKLPKRRLSRRFEDGQAA